MGALAEIVKSRDNRTQVLVAIQDQDMRPGPQDERRQNPQYDRTQGLHANRQWAFMKIGGQESLTIAHWVLDMINQRGPIMGNNRTLLAMVDRKISVIAIDDRSSYRSGAAVDRHGHIQLQDLSMLQILHHLKSQAS